MFYNYNDFPSSVTITYYISLIIYFYIVLKLIIAAPIIRKSKIKMGLKLILKIGKPDKN